MTDKEKIHQILSSLWKNDDSVGKTYYNQALQDVQTAIDLQKEPVSEELEEAAMQYAKLKHKDATLQKIVSWDFKAGAKWQKEQMMSQAIDGLVICDKELTQGYKDIVFSMPKELKVDDKVKMIIVKVD